MSIQECENDKLSLYYEVDRGKYAKVFKELRKGCCFKFQYTHKTEEKNLFAGQKFESSSIF